MPQVLVNLPGGYTFREEFIQGFGPVYVADPRSAYAALLTLSSMPPYKVYAHCQVHLTNGNPITIRLTDFEEFQDKNDITDNHIQTHKNNGEKKRDKIMKGLWP